MHLSEPREVSSDTDIDTAVLHLPLGARTALLHPRQPREKRFESLLVPPKDRVC